MFTSCTCLPHCIYCISLTAQVEDVVIDVLNDTTVRASWSPVTLQETSGYIISYTPTFNDSGTQQVNVSGRETTFVVISGLSPGEYQFQVQAMVVIDGEVFLGSTTIAKANITSGISILVHWPVSHYNSSYHGTMQSPAIDNTTPYCYRVH